MKQVFSFIMGITFLLGCILANDVENEAFQALLLQPITLADGRVYCNPAEAPEYYLAFMKTFPELLTMDVPPVAPDVLFTNHSHQMQLSESETDLYYVLYSWILKSQQDREVFSSLRLEIYNIYSRINHIFRMLAGGGTAFGHEEIRISAYVEYQLHKHGEDFVLQWQILPKKEELDFLRSSLWTVGTFSVELEERFSGMTWQERGELFAEVNHEIDKVIISISSDFHLQAALDYIDHVMEKRLEEGLWEIL